MKRIVFLSGLLTALALIAVLGTVAYMLFNIDGLVKEAASKAGRGVYGVDVTIADVDMSLKSGKGQLIGVRVANPSGFGARTAIEAPLVEVSVDTRRPTADAIALRQVKLVRPRVNLDVIGGAANLAAIGKAVAGSSEGSSAGQKLIVDEFLIVDGELTLRADFLGGRELSAKMPDMRVVDIGKQENGAAPDVLARIAFDTLVRAAERATRRFDLAAATNGKAPDIDFKKLLEN